MCVSACVRKRFYCFYIFVTERVFVQGSKSAVVVRIPEVLGQRCGHSGWRSLSCFQYLTLPVWIPCGLRPQRMWRSAGFTFTDQISATITLTKKSGQKCYTFYNFFRSNCAFD